MFRTPTAITATVNSVRTPSSNGFSPPRLVVMLLRLYENFPPHSKLRLSFRTTSYSIPVMRESLDSPFFLSLALDSGQACRRIYAGLGQAPRRAQIRPS